MANEIAYAQMAIARVVYNKLFNLDSSVFIGGGAPRDWALGRSADDLDVYLHIPDQQEYFQTSKLLRTILGEGVVVKPTGEYDLNHKMNKQISYVLTTHFRGLKIDFICVRQSGLTPRDLFDFGLSEAFATWPKDKYHLHWDNYNNGREKWKYDDGPDAATCVNLQVSNLFIRDIKRKELTQTGHFYTSQPEYIEKLKLKFPKYKHKSYNRSNLPFEKYTRVRFGGVQIQESGPVRLVTV